LGYGQSTPFDALIDFLINKTSPPARVVVDWLKGKTREGKPTTLANVAYGAFTPISIQNALKAKDDVSADKVAAVILDLVGINANSYTDDNPVKRDIINRLRQGQNLTAEQQDVYDNLPKNSQKDIDKKANMTAKEEAFSNLPAPSMIYTWSKLSDDDRYDLQDIYDKKIKEYIKNHDLQGAELDSLEENMDKAEQRKWGVK
jgi:hypothetical protein